MKRFQDRSIRAKLMLLIFTVTLIIVVLAGGARLVWDLTQDRHALAQEVSTLTHLLGNRSSAALAFDDPSLGKENLTSLQESHHIKVACLYHSNGTLLAVYNRDGKTSDRCPAANLLPDAGTHFEAQQLNVVEAIRQGNDILGWIYVVSDFSILYSHLRDQFAFSGLTLLVAVLVTVLLASWVQRLIAGPVVAVTAAARDIEQGGDYNRRAPVGGHDEMGEMARSFNAMLDALQTRTEELAMSRVEQSVLLTRYRSLFDNAGDVILLMDSESGHILDINPAASRRYGYTREELLGLHISDLNIPKENKYLPQMMAKLRNEGKAVFERHHCAKDGTVIPVEISTQLIKLEDRPVFLSIIRDLSERKHAQEKIEQSENKFRTLFDNASDAIVLLKNGHFIDCNPTALEVFQCQREDIIDSSPLTFSPPLQYDGQKSADKAKEKIDAALNGIAQRFDWRHSHLDGSTFDAEVSLNRIELDGEPTIQGIVRDITTRKRAEDAIKNIAAGVSAEIGEAFFRHLVVNLSKLFNANYVYIGVLDEKDAMRINTLAVAMDGVVADNFSYHLSGTPCANVVGQKTCIYHGELQQQFPKDERLKNLGVEIYIGTPLFDALGNPVGLITLLYDKTQQQIEWTGEILQIFAARASAELERVRAEQELFVKERAMEAATEGILLLDATKNNSIIYANRAMEIITGYSRFELLGHNLRVFEGPATEIETTTQLRDAVANRLACQVVIQNYRKDGTPFWNEVTITPVQNESGEVTHFIATQMDVTNRHHTEEALRRSQKMEAVGQLAGGVAHDFNNQLGIIIGYLDFLHDHLEDQDKPKQWVETATQATLRCMDLTRQLLAFSRQQSRETKVTDLNRELAGMETLIARSVTPSVTVQTFLGDDLWPVDIDPGEFRDVILNLAINARDAMPGGGHLIIETTNMIVETTYSNLNPGLPAGNYVHLMVSDTGCGMDKATLERAFEPFFTTKPEGKGTGLGLAMVYGFVNRYGGHIKLYSEPQVGTTFNVYLPRAAQSEESAIAETVDDILPGGSETILIVDDEIDLLQLAELYLLNAGYRTYTAKSAQEALKQLSQHPNIDMLFTDVVMPGDINGYTLAEQIVSIKPEIKVLLTSGFTANILAVNGQARFAAHLLRKPYRRADLVKHVRIVLDQES